ncbi:MAG: hypothetical protein V3T17_01290 [Pseudomonadales bacterium]
MRVLLRLSWLIVACLISINLPLLVASTTDLSTPNQTIQQRTQLIDANLMVVRLILGKLVINDALVGYYDWTQNKAFLSLAEFVSAIKFPITVDTATGTARGWFLRQGQTFELNVAQAQVQRLGKKEILTATEIVWHHDNLFISLDLLQHWFPLEIDFDINQLSVTLTSHEPLAIEQAFQRQKMRDKHVDRQNSKMEASSSPLSPYTLFSLPAIDFSYNSNYRADKGQQKTMAGRWNALIVGDLAYLNSAISISGTTPASPQLLKGFNPNGTSLSVSC